MFKRCFIWLLCCWLLPLLCVAQQFSGTGGAIPDAGSRVCFSIPVTGVGIINGAYGVSTVCLNIIHTWDADLEIILKAPDGTEVPLSIQNGGSGANYSGTCFSANATTPITAGSAPFTGTYLPQGYLGNVNNGQVADGEWLLCIRDLNDDDIGTLVNWSIAFTNQPAPPRPVCNNNIQASPLCTSAPLVCNFNGICGTTFQGNTSDNWPQLEAAFCGGTIENSSFVKFLAASTSATFNVWVTNSLNALGIQAMVFEGECGGAVTQKGCNARIFPSADAPAQIVATNLIPGNTYYLMIDGYLGDVCDYLIVAGTGISVLNVTPSTPQICPGENVQLVASGGNGTYSWSPDAGLSGNTGVTILAQPDTTTTYTVRSSSPTSCPLETKVTIVVHDKPDFGSDMNISICNGTFINLYNQFDTAGLATLWTVGNTVVPHPDNINTSGLYQLSGQNLFRCADTVQVTLSTVGKPNLGGDKLVSICPGDSIDLNSLFNIGNQMAVWTVRSTIVPNPAAVRSAGVYQVVVFNGSDCTDTANVTLFLNAAPVLGPDKEVNLCANTTVNLTTLFNTTGYSSNWTQNGQPVTSLQNVSPPGNFKLIATNTSGCSDTAEVVVRQVPALNLGANRSISICTGNQVVLDTVFNTAGIVSNWTYGALPVSATTPLSQPGIYTVIAINGPVCRDTSTLTLAIVDRPSLGNDRTANLCEGAVFNLNSLFAINTLSTAWTLGDSSVTNVQSVAVGGLYQLIATDNNGCTDTAKAELIIRPKPVIGKDTTVRVCPFIPVNLNSFVSTSGLTVSWKRNGLLVNNPTSVFTAGVYECVATNVFGCSDTVLVTVELLQKPNLGIDKRVPVCSGSAVNISAQYLTTGYIVKWTRAGIPVTGQPPIWVTQPGIYQLEVTNNFGCSDTALLTLFAAAPTKIGRDTIVSACFGTAINLNTLYDTAGLTSSWFYYGIRVTTPDAIVAPGVYNVIATNAAGCADTAEVFVALNPKPSLGADKSMAVCAGLIFDLTTQFNTIGLNTEWSYQNAAVADPAAVSATGIYQLIAQNAAGCRDTALVNVFTTTTLNLGSDTVVSLCEGTTVNLLSIYRLTGISSDWSFGGLPVANPLQASTPGVYSLVADNGQGCVDTVLVNLVPKNNPSIGVDKTGFICQYNSFDLTTAFNTSNYISSWTFGGNPLLNAAAFAPGIYQLVVTDNNGCKDTASISLSIIANPSLGNDRGVALCGGDAVNLTNKFPTVGLTQNWLYHGVSATLPGVPVSNPQSVSLLGFYSLVATDVNRCSDTALLRIVPYPKPELGDPKTTGYCPGNTVDLTALFRNDYANFATAIWTQNGQPVANPYNVNSIGVYRLVAGYLQGCADTTTVVVQAYPKPSLGADRTISLCPGSSIGLDVQYATAGLSTQWTFAGAPVLNPTGVNVAGIYALRATNSNGCSDTAFVNIVPQPGPALGVDKKITTCTGNVVDLTAQYSTTGLTANFTNQGVVVPIPSSVTTAGTYRLVVSNAVGCSDTAFITVTLLPKPFLGPDKTDSICPYETLNLFSLFDTTGLSCNWTFNGAAVAQPDSVAAAGIYQLIGSNAVGCRDTAMVNLFVKAISYGADTIRLCSNQLPLRWNNADYTSAGSYQVRLTNLAGCDSLVTLQLLVADTSSSETRLAVCSNQLPLRWNGSDYYQPGRYQAVLLNATGCDSVASLILTVVDTSSSITDLVICNNQLPLFWNGLNLQASATYSALLSNAAGCDSIAVLNLLVADTSAVNVSMEVCENTLPLVWNGQICLSAGNYTARLVNIAGCDSVVNLQLLVKDTSVSTTAVNVCSNQLPFTWNGNSYSTTGAYAVRLTNASGCDSVANLLLTVTDTSSYESAVTVCNNQLPYRWNGINYSASGNYTIRLTNAAGCDSVLLLRLMVADTSVSTTTVNLCSNHFPFEWNNSTFTGPGNYPVALVNAAGCDSIARLQLNLVDTTTSFDTARVCNNQLPFVWNSLSCNSAGNYQVQLTNTAGCDSVAYLHLLVSDTSFSTTSVNVCSNQLPYRWNSNDYTTAGTYSVRLINAAGCDSVAKLQLTVTDTSFYEEAVTVCNNQLPYVWNGNPYVVSGNYAVQLVNAGGCDSIVRLRLKIADTTVSSTEVNLCSNQFPYRWNNNTYVQPGDYTVLLVNAGGCDSIAHLSLNRIDTTVSFDTVRLCNNQLPYLWNGISLAVNGDYQQRLLNANGCDSVAYLHLVVSDTSFSSTTAVVCNNQLPYRWNNNAYSLAGDYSIRLVNAVGCDSLAKLRLIINDTNVSHTYITRCDVQGPYTWNGQSYTSSGVYSYLGTNQAGCDSLAWLHLTVNGSTASSTNIDTCENSLPFTWNGLNCAAAGIYRVVLQNAAGCDSVCTLTLTVKRNTNSISIDSVCRNQLPYRWNNNSYTATGSYQVLLTNAAGCDSIATLQLFVKDTSESSSRISRCRNQLPYRWNGTDLIASGIYQRRFVNSVGCDSVAKLEFVVLDTSTSLTNISVCSNQLPYDWNGNSYAAAGNYWVRLQNAAGCDSVATLQLTVKRTSTSVTTESICPSTLPFSWNGAVYTAAGTYQQILVNAAGCDSIAELRLSVKANSTSDTTVRICESNLPYVWNGMSYNQAGRYTKSFVNAVGCDSIAVLNVVVLRRSYATIRKSLCTSDLPYSWNGNAYSAAGTYYATLVNAAGCDSLVTLELTVNPNPVKPILGADTLICPGDKLLLNPGNYYAYFWQNRSTTPTIEAEQAGLYTVRVGNEFGCYSFASRNVGVLNDCDDIYFANAFSPNGDGKNETFGPLGNLFVVSKYNFTIFNRYGKIVFVANNPYQKWNGQINGVAAPPGNYIWKAVYQYRSKLNQVRSGNVLLLR